MKSIMFSVMIFAAVIFVLCSRPLSAKEKPVLLVTNEEMSDLLQKAIKDGKNERNGPEIMVFLEREEGVSRQYITFTMNMALGGQLGISRIDFIQEEWRKNTKGQDEINQWAIVVESNGNMRSSDHILITEDHSSVVSESFLSKSDEETAAVVKKIIDLFLGRMKLV